MLTTLIILATIAVAGLAWHQLAELKEKQQSVAPIRIRVDENIRSRRRR